MTSFVDKKRLRFVITLSTGRFGNTENDTVTLEGFRATADINKAGGMMMGTLRAVVYGVSQQVMNTVTTLQWKPDSLIPNTVQVFAIVGTAETLVFAGNIINAWGDYDGQPDVFLQIQAQSAYFSQLIAVQPRSFKGGIDAATVMQQIAASMGLVFENNGVNVQLSDVYLDNTDTEQARDLARMADIDLYIDDTVLAITPRNAPRAAVVPVISSATGMISYPTFDGIGVNFRALFNPAVTFGGLIRVETDVVRAAGEWIVTSINHRLECEKPDGAWFSQIRGNANGLAVVRQ